jgi:hypothetical protein
VLKARRGYCDTVYQRVAGEDGSPIRTRAEITDPAAVNAHKAVAAMLDAAFRSHWRDKFIAVLAPASRLPSDADLERLTPADGFPVPIASANRITDVRND